MSKGTPKVWGAHLSDHCKLHTRLHPEPLPKLHPLHEHLPHGIVSVNEHNSDLDWSYSPIWAPSRVGMVKKFTSKKKFETFAGLLVKLLPAKMVKMVKNI